MNANELRERADRYDRLAERTLDASAISALREMAKEYRARAAGQERVKEHVVHSRGRLELVSHS
jgi:hypothetical protein